MLTPIQSSSYKLTLRSLSHNNIEQEKLYMTKKKNFRRGELLEKYIVKIL